MFLNTPFHGGPYSLTVKGNNRIQFSNILISFGFNSSPLAAYNIRMSEYIHKRHNVTVLLYHLVFPAQYRRAVVDGNVDETIRDVCLKIVTS